MSGCASSGPKLPPGTPVDANGAPILKIELGKKYYVDNTEDKALQRKMTEALVVAINENPDELEADAIEKFYGISNDKSCGESESYTTAMRNGLKMNLHGRIDVRGKKSNSHCGYTNIIFSNFVCTYEYRYKRHPLTIFGLGGEPYGHKYSAKMIDGGHFEIAGFESEKEAIDIYLLLHKRLTDVASDMWETVEEKFGKNYDPSHFFQRPLLDLDIDALRNEKRLVLKVQILDASLKKPLEDLVLQTGGEATDNAAGADVIVAVKLIGYPPMDTVKQVAELIEDGDIDLGFNNFQNEISFANLGASMSHAGMGKMGMATAGLGAAMMLFGGSREYGSHLGIYLVRVIDKKSGKLLFQRIVTGGGKKGLWVVSNSPVYLQMLAYDAASELIGKSNHTEN